MRLRLALVAVVAATFAATAQAAMPPGKIVKLALPAANHAKLYEISAKLKAGLPPADATMGILVTNFNSLPGGIRAGAATWASTSGGTTTFHVLVGINNLGGRSVQRVGAPPPPSNLGEIDLDLIYSATTFSSLITAPADCAMAATIIRNAIHYHFVQLGGWTSTPQHILEYVVKKLGC